MKAGGYIVKGVGIVTLVLLPFASITLAGDPIFRQVQGGDRIEALRMAYITEQLNLTPFEVEHFWSVYAEYRSYLTALEQDFKPQNSHITAAQQFDLGQKKFDLKKKYKPQFEAAIGVEKCMLMNWR